MLLANHVRQPKPMGELPAMRATPQQTQRNLWATIRLIRSQVAPTLPMLKIGTNFNGPRLNIEVTMSNYQNDYDLALAYEDNGSYYAADTSYYLTQ